ncbi:MAG: flavodoxin [Tissierellia bacterium]|nr:flavodoxin [Tissierellia bacterium]
MDGKLKGLIAYSSKTGNTKKLAETIFRELQNQCQVTLLDLKEHKIIDAENYDFILLGGWVDKAKPDKAVLKILEKIEPKNLGIFVTMGAMPDSPHGEDVKNNIKEILKKYNSLGYGICPGTVDEKVIARMKMIPDMIIPKSVKDKMVEPGNNSREATEEERIKVANEYKESVKNMEQKLLLT